MTTEVLELFGLAVLLLVCGAIYLADGPAALTAVVGAASVLFATWRGTQRRRRK